MVPCTSAGRAATAVQVHGFRQRHNHDVSVGTPTSAYSETTPALKRVSNYLISDGNPRHGVRRKYRCRLATRMASQRHSETLKEARAEHAVWYTATNLYSYL